MVERIKRALELARQERESAIAATAADALPDEASAAATEVPVPAPSAAGAASDASDAKRTIAVNEHTLQEARLLLPGMVGDASHGFRILRTQVLQRMLKRGWNTLAVLSPGPDEGKTFTAINLAIAIAAHRDSTALLVDLDLRFPRIHRRLGFLPAVGRKPKRR